MFFQKWDEPHGNVHDHVRDHEDVREGHDRARRPHGCGHGDEGDHDHVPVPVNHHVSVPECDCDHHDGGHAEDAPEGRYGYWNVRDRYDDDGIHECVNDVLRVNDCDGYRYECGNAHLPLVLRFRISAG